MFSSPQLHLPATDYPLKRVGTHSVERNVNDSRPTKAGHFNCEGVRILGVGDRCSKVSFAYPVNNTEVEYLRILTDLRISIPESHHDQGGALCQRANVKLAV